MGLEAQFSAMSTQTVTVASLSTVNSYGAPSYSTSPTTYTAYIEPGSRVVVNSQGVEEIATAMLIVLSSSAVIGPQDKITLPGGRTPKLLSVEPMHDDRGQHHVEVQIR